MVTQLGEEQPEYFEPSPIYTSALGSLEYSEREKGGGDAHVATASSARNRLGVDNADKESDRCGRPLRLAQRSGTARQVLLFQLIRPYELSLETAYCKGRCIW